MGTEVTGWGILFFVFVVKGFNFFYLHGNFPAKALSCLFTMWYTNELDLMVME